jgi:CHAT domain-containing protein
MNLTLLLKRGGGLRSGAALATLPMFGLSTLLFVTLAGVQTGCVRQPSGVTAPGIVFRSSAGLDVGNAVCVGENKVGETCYVYIEESRRGTITQEAKVLCGRWDHSSVRIFEVKHSGASHSLEEWAENSWWRRDEVEARAHCNRSGETKTILTSPDGTGGMQVQLLDCKLRSGGWPYFAWVARSNEATYLVDGIPAAQGITEKAIGIISGRLDKTADVCRGAPTKWILEAMLSKKSYGASDLAEYYRLMTLGQYYNGVKDFAAAENRYREALTFHRTIVGEGDPESMDPLMHIALELSNQERFDEADVLFKQVEAFLPGASDQADRARYLSYQALHLANQRYFEDARKLAAEATKLRKNLLSKWDFQGRHSDLQSNPMGVVALPPDTADVVQSRYIEAAMLRRLGKEDEAEQVYREAKSTLRAAKRAPPLWTPQLEALGARIADSNKIREERLGESIDLWKVYAPGERPGALDYIEAGANYRAQGRLDDALIAFKTGIDLVRGQGSFRFEQLLPYFRTVLELAESRPARRDELYKQMFEAGQLVRGSRTRQDIARAAVRLGAQNSEAQKLIRELQDAENDSYIQRRRLAAEKIWDRGKVVQQYQERLAEELAIGQRTKDARNQVHDAFPHYNQLIDAVVDADEVLKALKPGEALVQVLLGSTESLLFLVRDGTIRAYRLQITEEEVNSTVDVIIQKGLMRPTTSFDVAAAYRLYQRLFSSVSNEIKNAKHLITVPTGALLSLPYGLLVTEEPSLTAQQDAPAREKETTQRGLEIVGKDGKSQGLSNYANVAWLAKLGAISLAPSVRSFIDLRRVDRSRATKAFVGFGDPIPFTDNSIKKLNLPENCLKHVANYQASIKNLRELPNTKKELSGISGMFPADSTVLVLSKEFTEQKVKTYPLQDYRILYFATHGLLPGEFQCQPEPSLVASPSDSTREGDEGLIDASEILHFKLDADLVVLSACNTGGPGAEKEIRGENLSGLARAFFFAGARSLLASHWYLPDKETAGLMIDTFKGLYNQNDPKGLAIALNLAQRELMKDGSTSHPFYWAGLSLVGDGARIVSQQ